MAYPVRTTGRRSRPRKRLNDAADSAMDDTATTTTTATESTDQPSPLTAAAPALPRRLRKLSNSTYFVQPACCPSFLFADLCLARSAAGARPTATACTIRSCSTYFVHTGRLSSAALVTCRLLHSPPTAFSSVLPTAVADTIILTATEQAALQQAARPAATDFLCAT